VSIKHESPVKAESGPSGESRLTNEQRYKCNTEEFAYRDTSYRNRRRKQPARPRTEVPNSTIVPGSGVVFMFT